jgi:hypothetical protein
VGEHLGFNDPRTWFARGSIDDVLAKDGLTRRLAMSGQHYSVMPLLLQSTDLVCALPHNRYRDVLNP